MIKYNYDFTYNYYTTFDDETGAYFRSNVMDKDGEMTETEPFMGDFPHLIDVGVMGHCRHGLSGRCLASGTFCYQEGNEVTRENMSLEDYTQILKQCSGKVQQFALGGRGDADCHEDFEEMLRLTRDYDIVPNITTSGYLFDEDKAQITKKYCGAAAVSWYKTPYTYKAIELLVEAGVTTNIHFILSSESIEEACGRLEERDFPPGISAVIFLLYKPVGNVNEDLVLQADNEYLERFFGLIDQADYPFGLGFDSCSTTGIVAYCKNVADECIEPCEGGRFSTYIDSDMKMYPCSFIQKDRFTVDLREHTILEAWESRAFEGFRQQFMDPCPRCEKRVMCLGGCPSISSINLCRAYEEGVVL